MAAPRSSGSLTISFGLVASPVKLYTATQSTGQISFNLLHKVRLRPASSTSARRTARSSNATTWSRATSLRRTSTSLSLREIKT
jgi:hypothetical protein